MVLLIRTLLSRRPDIALFHILNTSDWSIANSQTGAFGIIDNASLAIIVESKYAIGTYFRSSELCLGTAIYSDFG